MSQIIARTRTDDTDVAEKILDNLLLILSPSYKPFISSLFKKKVPPYLDEELLLLFPRSALTGLGEFRILLCPLAEREEQYKRQYYSLILSLQRTQVFSAEIIKRIAQHFYESCMTILRTLYRNVCIDRVFRRGGRLESSLVFYYIEHYKEEDSNHKLYRLLKHARRRYNQSPYIITPVDPRRRQSNTNYRKPYTDLRHISACRHLDTVR